MTVCVCINIVTLLMKPLLLHRVLLPVVSEMFIACCELMLLLVFHTGDRK